MYRLLCRNGLRAPSMKGKILLRHDRHRRLLYLSPSRASPDAGLGRDVVAYLRYATQDAELDVALVFVRPAWRRCGLATRLMRRAIALAGQRKVTLDDMSDRYRRPGNIYRRLGFRYVDRDGGPEMAYVAPPTCKRYAKASVST